MIWPPSPGGEPPPPPLPPGVGGETIVVIDFIVFYIGSISKTNKIMVLLVLHIKPCKTNKNK